VTDSAPGLVFLEGVLLVDGDVVPALHFAVQCGLPAVERIKGHRDPATRALLDALRDAAARARGNANADLVVSGNERRSLITASEVAEVIGRTHARVRQVAAELGIEKRGGRWLFEPQDVDAIQGRTHDERERGRRTGR
jgi:hypothetical protein